ncbi:PREDICTED: protein FAM73B-like [Priapulus caudatus]|uniref:Protein FAM73B-like n=1 Tax=Priapulus caudatus TaxID=37621 RepID=A0ABM1E629_PRICU|nr:PREDICTED: protein FAM73B-like [Priapulus caudatus]
MVPMITGTVLPRGPYLGRELAMNEGHADRQRENKVIGESGKRPHIYFEDFVQPTENHHHLLAKATKDPKDFIVLLYNEMLLYVKDGENWDDIMEELEGRGVQEMSFVDIALDFILLDAFEDLENPPSSVLAVMQNRWLSNGFKETALLTAVWSVLKAKRRRLKQPNGFIAHFYHISEHVSPVLAWGFLGPRSRLKELCELFKDQVLGFMQDMFSLRKCQYTTVEQLADDIIVLARHHCEHVLEKLAVSPLTDTSRENSKFPH